MTNDLTRKAIITGGSSELALACAAAMIADGIFPVLSYRSEKGLKKIASALGDAAYTAVPLVFGDDASLDAFFASVPSDCSIFVDCAHGGYESLVGASDPAQVARYYDENVVFRAKLLRGIVRMMMGNRTGRLVYVSSTAAGIVNPGQGFYASSKAACEALYRSVGIECARSGITAVSLRFGYIAAGRGRGYLDANPGALKDIVPSAQALTADEAARTILYFASDAACAVNAAEIVIDGGMSAIKTRLS